MDKDTIKRIAAALFFIGGIALISWVVLVIGQERGLTQKKFHVTVHYKDVAGLIEGAPVRISGVNVGTVAHIGFRDGDHGRRGVEVILNIFEKFRPQLEGKSARFAIKTEGILGQKLVEIYIDEDGEPIDLAHPIHGDESVNVEDLAEVFAAAAESFTETSSELSKIDVNMLSNSLADTADSMRQTSEHVDHVLYEVERITLKSKRLLNRVEQKLIDGTLFKIF